MTNFFRLPVLIGALALVAAAQQKIAVIDVQSALIATQDGKKAAADLSAKYSPRDQALQRRQAEIQAKQEQYRKNQATMSADARAAAEKDLDNLTRTFQRDAQDAQQDLEQDQQRILQQLGPRMVQVVEKYAKDHGINIVFNLAAEPQMILYTSNAVDITRDIVALYDIAPPQMTNAATGSDSRPALPAPKPGAPLQTPAPKPPAPAPPKPQQ